MVEQALHTGPAASGRKTAEPFYEFNASKSRFAYAWSDLKQAFSRPKLILTLIRNGFLSRYQGTLLGGLWITITTSMTVAGLALLYGQIFSSPLQEYFPFVAIGIVVWGLISSLINDGASVFLAASVVFNQSPISKSIFALRSIGIAAVAFLFKLIVVAVVLVAVGIRPSATDILLSAAGLAIVFWTGFWFALGAGTIGARFRDVGQLTSAIVTFAFFFTPVFWQPSRLGSYQFVVEYNPLFHFLNVIRGPLIGADGIALSFAWAVGTSIAVTIGGMLIFGFFGRRLCYWT
ncbi:MAG TPA: ABC transporter permease [Parvularculaceae bacterium]|nr:ABC transporter permease [Parvularculaceae bacterium]